MTKDEAMRLALEALIVADKRIVAGGLASDARLQMKKAIAALSQTLEQPEQTVSLEEYKRLQRLVTSQGIRLMEYESKQEPVAWMYVNKDGECEQIEFGDPFNDPSVTLLYTAPPKREWQGLTDEEIAEGQRNSWVDKQAFESAVWWAEERLKDKNRD